MKCQLFFLFFLAWSVKAIPDVTFKVTDSVPVGNDIQVTISRLVHNCYYFLVFTTFLSLDRKSESDTEPISCPLYCNGDRCSSTINCPDVESCETLELDTMEKEKTINFTTKDVGHIKLYINCTGQVNFVEVAIFRNKGLFVASYIIGWTYFVAWSASFYPQVIVNFRRKSVIGLNFDFVGLNLMGFAAYGVFNVCLYFVPFFQDLYRSANPLSTIPVELNDVFFAVHAAILVIVVIIQCLIYERGDQTVALWALTFMGVAVAVSAILLILCVLQQYSWLSFIYFFSYLKLVITIIKYVPQAWLNYQRKSTVGWSIHNIFLDFTGGVLSIGQMFLLSVNFNDWQSTFGNPTKLGLGLFSILFDILFIVQHYFLYRHSRRDSQIVLSQEEEINGIPSPILG